jgi:hypothetical protein
MEKPGAEPAVEQAYRTAVAAPAAGWLFGSALGALG